jgi:ribosome modulation factor
MTEDRDPYQDDRNPYHDEEMSACWYEGYLAHKNGRFLLECPYEVSERPDYAAAWTLGWAMGEEDNPGAI